MTQGFQKNDDRPDSKPDDAASHVDSPEQAMDAPERDLESPPEPATRRVGESGVGPQSDEASEFTTPTGDGNYQKVGDRNVSISGEDEVQQ